MITASPQNPIVRGEGRSGPKAPPRELSHVGRISSFKDGADPHDHDFDRDIVDSWRGPEESTKPQGENQLFSFSLYLYLKAEAWDLKKRRSGTNAPPDLRNR
jgi:hypothetical protein